MTDFFEFLRLLLGTVIYRPYVYGFFVCFLFFSLKQLKLRGTFVFLFVAYLVAYASEWSATRNGFPFGMYVYLDETRTRELWLSNIPFWDSLSFVFLSYFSWLAAASFLNPRDGNSALLETRTAIFGGFLMMMLDVIIDPLTLHGDQWFLGKIYYYPNGGSYFGVTLSNFAGWWFVGSSTLFLIQFLARKTPAVFGLKQQLSRTVFGLALGVYAGVMIFNLAVTAYIREWTLFFASLGVAGVVLFALGTRFLRVKPSLPFTRENI